MLQKSCKNILHIFIFNLWYLEIFLHFPFLIGMLLAKCVPPLLLRIKISNFIFDNLNSHFGSHPILVYCVTFKKLFELRQSQAYTNYVSVNHNNWYLKEVISDWSMRVAWLAPIQYIYFLWIFLIWIGHCY